MAISAEPGTGQSSNASNHEVNDKLQYEDTTTFSDPLPTKEDSFVNTVSDSDEDGEALRKNPFLDPDVAEHWAAVYEKSQYESRHAFDPSFTWSEEEERKLVRRLDWRVCFWACVMFFGLQVDRGNLAQAVADNLLHDLKLNTNGRLLSRSQSKVATKSEIHK